MNENQSRGLFRWNPEITLGHLLQIASFAAVLAAMWFNMDKRLTSVEMRQDYTKEERQEIKQTLKSLSENQALLARTVDRLSILFEEKRKENP